MKYCLSGLRTDCNQRNQKGISSWDQPGVVWKQKQDGNGVDGTKISGGINNDIKKMV